MRFRSMVYLGVVCLLFGLTATASADVPTSMNVQGQLTDDEGVPISEATVFFTFKVYDAETGGTEIWPVGPGEEQALYLNKSGLWNAHIGAVIPLTEAVFADSARWLEVTVDTDGPGPDPTETLSRIKLNTNPYTFRAASSQWADTADFAIEAGHSTHSDTTEYAVHADSASYADTSYYSIHADTAIYADTSVYTTYADTAYAVITSQTYRRLGAELTYECMQGDFYQQVGNTISIPPDSVTSYIIVVMRVSSQLKDQIGGIQKAWMDIRIGETGLEVSRDEVAFSERSDDDNSSDFYKDVKTLQYYYEPTASEKSNGFNIKMFMKVFAGNAASACLHTLEVFGL